MTKEQIEHLKQIIQHRFLVLYRGADGMLFEVSRIGVKGGTEVLFFMNVPTDASHPHCVSIASVGVDDLKVLVNKDIAMWPNVR